MGLPRYLELLFCRHLKTRDGTQMFEDIEDDIVFVYVYCTRCGRNVGQRTVGYHGDGIIL